MGVFTARSIGDPRRRQRVATVAMLSVLLLILGRLVWIQGLDQGAVAALALEQREVTKSIFATRGEIEDRKGTALALSVTRYNIWVDQRQVSGYERPHEGPQTPADTGVAAAAADLAPVLNLSVAKLTEALSGKAGYAYVKKLVDPSVRRAVAAMKIPGIGSDQVTQRVYPGGEIAAGVLGFSGADGRPLGGLELGLQSHLKGTNGSQTFETGVGGERITTGSYSSTPAKNGSNAVLTIDRDLQFKAQQVLQGAMKKWGGSSASLVAMDPKTGQVLAMANTPTFDANQPGEAKPEDLGNAAVSQTFEPGSTGKLFTMAALLDTGKQTPMSEVSAPYLYEAPNGQTFNDSHHHRVQKLTMAGVMYESSNTGTIQLSERVSPQTRFEYMQRFGIGEPTGLSFPGQSNGLLRNVADWDGRTLYATSFGQGYGVTALQQTNAFAAVANNGVRLTPQLVQEYENPDGSTSPVDPGPTTRVVKPETAEQLRAILDTDVPEDNSRNGAIPGYTTGGKTGTAEQPGTDEGYTASFVGMAPMNDPKIVVGVFVHGLKKYVPGGTVAAPPFADFTGFALQHLGIAPSGVAATDLRRTWK